MEVLIALAAAVAYSAVGGVVGGLVHSRLRRREKMGGDEAAVAAVFSGIVWPAGVGVAIGVGVSDRAERKRLQRLERIDALEARADRIAELERELALLPADEPAQGT